MVRCGVLWRSVVEYCGVIILHCVCCAVSYSPALSEDLRFDKITDLSNQARLSLHLKNVLFEIHPHIFFIYFAKSIYFLPSENDMNTN